MESQKGKVRIVGVLYIVQMVAAVMSYSVILEPILYKASFLQELASNSNMVIFAMILDLVVGAAVFGIAVMLYPILRKFSERIAIWYAGQRLTEFVGFMISGLLLLTILKIGQDIGEASSTDAQYLEAIAIYLREARGNIQNIALFVYCLGAWSLYGLLYHSRLLPAFIPIWGILGVTLLFIEITANIFGTRIGGIMIMMPLGLNEIFLGLWLIIKGFRDVDNTAATVQSTP